MVWCGVVWCGVVWCVMVWQFEKCVFHWTAGAAGRDHFQPDNGSQPAGCEMEKSQVPIVRLLVVTDLDCCDSFPLCGVVWCGVVWYGMSVLSRTHNLSTAIPC